MQLYGRIKQHPNWLRYATKMMSWNLQTCHICSSRANREFAELIC